MNKKSFLWGKKFLITQPMIRSFCGSTMVTLELAEYLASVGAKVMVYTNVALPPALSYFETARIKVISSRDKHKLSLKDFDYVWVHSLTFPQEMLEELKHPPKKVPAFVFLHMSPLEYIPDEHPWIYNLENSLSSLSLYISEKTLESNEKYGLPSRTGLFRNPAPLSFKKLAERKVSQTLRKVLIVSNHPPAEVMEARNRLVEKGVRVDIYGEGQDKYAPISPEIMKKYDAIITIGKTVQYCIVGLLPVYIYDWFGGPGWLTKTNYEKTKMNNFSGRPFSKKNGKEIVEEIIDGYTGALEFFLGYLAEYKDEFIIDNALGVALRDLKPRRLEPLDSEYIESAKAAVGCAELRFIASEELGDSLKQCSDLIRQLEESREQIEMLSGYKEQFDAMINSRRYKMMNKIFEPHDRVVDFLKKKDKRRSK